jgi:hypothetical protein
LLLRGTGTPFSTVVDHGEVPMRDVPFPMELADRVPSEAEVLAHRAGGLSGSRWSEAITNASLPAPTGVMATKGTFALTRQEIFDHAETGVWKQGVSEISAARNSPARIAGSGLRSSAVA